MKNFIWSLVVVTLLAVSACCPCRKQKSTPKNQLPLLQTEWSLSHLHARGIVPEGNYWIVFESDSTFHGVGDCNRFFGSYSQTNGRLSIHENIGMTRMACPNGKQEGEFLKMLSEADSYRIDGSTLMLLKEGEVIGVMEGKTAPESTGKEQ